MEFEFKLETIRDIDECVTGKHNDRGNGTAIIHCGKYTIALVNNNGDAELRNENHMLRSNTMVCIWGEDGVQSFLERIISCCPEKVTLSLHNNLYIFHDNFADKEAYKEYVIKTKQ